MQNGFLTVLFLAVFILFMSGCNCDPESDAELCGEQNCGLTSLFDDCGDERELDCGECPGGENCEDNICICEPEDNDELCAAIDAECGVHSTEDRCGEERDVNCGGCSAPDECMQGSCECVGESEDELCTAHGFDCGSATATDVCGDERLLSCGGCPAPHECDANICDCEGESESQLCNDYDLECGQSTVEDSCERTRELDCGTCSGPDECFDNICECVAETDDELCNAGGHCGDVEVTDVCGDERLLTCQPCSEGDVTFGAVRDGDSGALIDDALIRIYSFPPPGGEHFSWAWPTGYRAGDPDFSTTTGADNGNGVNYEFASDEPICIDDQLATLEPEQWYRIVVDRPGYNTGIFYRLHPGYDSDDCPSHCPTSSSSGCSRQDFELFADEANHLQYPNLVADVRDLEDYEWQCAQLPDDHTYDELIGLRVRLGGANIGQGPFHLEGRPGDDGSGEVVQYVYRPDGTTATYLVNSDFEYHEGHNHIHFMDWFGMRLVNPTEECRDAENRPASCVTNEGTKISYCLHDLEPFDGDVRSQFGGDSALFLDPPTCDTTEQGVTQGWKDSYSRGLPGQVIIVGTPAQSSGLGSQWIEAEVDPDQVLQEVERDGNIARRLVEVPADLCSDSSMILDCSMPPDQYTTTPQMRNCRDFVNYE